jgi:hypothetical protein
MSYLLFMDESGHDHKHMPYEVRGGVTLHASKLWGFVREMAALEQDCFGERLFRFKTEIKGHKLLDKDRFKWAAQMDLLDPMTRRQNASAFLKKGMTKEQQNKIEFSAYGQASLLMAHGIFDLLAKYDGRIFAGVIPATDPKTTAIASAEYLRKDHVFMLERFFYYLDNEQQTGLIVMDETDKALDRTYVQKMERYFIRTATGQQRSKWIVPSPFFVSSDMTYPAQAADVCIYCVNVGVRINHEMDKPVREEVAEQYGKKIKALQWQDDIAANGQSFRKYGIVYVPDPYTARQ